MNFPAISEGRKWRFVVALVAAVFIAVATFAAALMMRSIDSIVINADELDDARAGQAAFGAVQAMRDSLASTIRDNAYWDDAYSQIAGPDAAIWALETWGSFTADYPLYDTAIVIGPDDETVLAYTFGKEMKLSPRSYFGPSFAALLKAARNTAGTSAPIPVHFIGSKNGIALIAGAAIQPYEAADISDPGRSHVLLFAKHVTPLVISELSETFNINGLTFNPEPRAGMLSLIARDVTGTKAAYFNWPPVKPGTKSFAEAKSQIDLALIILGLLLFAVAVLGGMTIQGLRRSEAVSRNRALHDRLTGLWNRAGMMENLPVIAETNDDRNGAVTLHLIDLDEFKIVNDTWGHAVGDRLIAAVAERLTHEMPQHAAVVRIAGDEFGVISPGASSSLANWMIGERIQSCLRRVFEVDDRSVEISASGGSAWIVIGDADGEELLRRAGVALRRAKKLGRGVIVAFDAEFDAAQHREQVLEADLRETLAGEGIGVNFQPVVDARDGSIRGVEALARWQPSDGSRVGPDTFIPLAERCGLIDRLGLQILEKAVAAAREWPGLGLSVNVSPLQLKNRHFAGDVDEILKKSGFDPKRLTFELTEGVLISHPGRAKRAIDGLRKRGIKVALDDFGSGYASIGALRQFHFDRMKIDRSLILALDTDANGAAVLQATIALAKALHIPVTAEGIETEEQASILRSSGCNQLQGYLFSKPVSAEAISETYFAASGEPESGLRSSA